MKVKDVIIAFCRQSGCPVQESMDTHRANQGSEDDIKLIKYSHCVRCDIWKFRKWMEANHLIIIQEDPEDCDTDPRFF